MSNNKSTHVSEVNWRARNMWPTCKHGYYETPSHHCPWCKGTDTSNYVRHAGRGNGWLLTKDDKACDDCGGPASAGFGAVVEGTTKEQYEEAKKKIQYCYGCSMARRYNTQEVGI